MTDNSMSDTDVGQREFPDITFGPPRWRNTLHPQLIAAVEENPAGAFRALFDGRTVAFGYSKGDGIGTGRELTLEHYRRHLDGDGSDAAWSLGLIPVRDDNTVKFGVLDFDAPGLKTIEVESVVRRSSER